MDENDDIHDVDHVDEDNANEDDFDGVHGVNEDVDDADHVEDDVDEGDVDEDDVDEDDVNEGDDYGTHEADGDDEQQSVQNTEETAKNKLNQFKDVLNKQKRPHLLKMQKLPKNRKPDKSLKAEKASYFQKTVDEAKDAKKGKQLFAFLEFESETEENHMLLQEKNLRSQHATVDIADVKSKPKEAKNRKKRDIIQGNYLSLTF
ncbi:nucleolin-like [Stegodyphus dumicola]|uniref:nucleolin-like n=1 Tax=Stegodyphus dumicola TaxID=202533 RepID=UPI0015B29D2A|nr:nucleolin-like [Stegodyphus dumicola]